jgi:hypothetical protein
MVRHQEMAKLSEAGPRPAKRLRETKQTNTLASGSLQHIPFLQNILPEPTNSSGSPSALNEPNPGFSVPLEPESGVSYTAYDAFSDAEFPQPASSSGDLHAEERNTSNRAGGTQFITLRFSASDIHVCEALRGEREPSPNASTPHHTLDLAAISGPAWMFRRYETRPPTAGMWEQVHELWFIRLVLLMVAYLHTQMQTSFKACAIILSVLKLIFIGLGLLPNDGRSGACDFMPTTLKCTLGRLGLADKFEILAACPSCHALHHLQKSMAASGNCYLCQAPLFASTGILPNLRSVIGLAGTLTQPKLSVPFCAPHELIEDFLQRPGMEDEMTAWRDDVMVDGEMREIYHGKVWQELRGPEGGRFFDVGESSELRIGLVLSMDWYALVHS